MLNMFWSPFTVIDQFSPQEGAWVFALTERNSFYYLTIRMPRPSGKFKGCYVAFLNKDFETEKLTLGVKNLKIDFLSFQGE